MAINFPSNPSLNDIITAGTTRYQWDGTSWTSVPVSEPGPTGPTDRKSVV